MRCRQVKPGQLLEVPPVCSTGEGGFAPWVWGMAEHVTHDAGQMRSTAVHSAHALRAPKRASRTMRGTPHAKEVTGCGRQLWRMKRCGVPIFPWRMCLACLNNSTGRRGAETCSAQVPAGAVPGPCDFGVIWLRDPILWSRVGSRTWNWRL